MVVSEASEKAASAAKDLDPTPTSLLSNGLACTASSDCQTGNCIDGVCCNNACGNGDESDCQDCNLAGSAGICTTRAPGSVCRGAPDLCDQAETCDGESLFCPPDTFKAAATPCRPSAGACDIAEACTGSSPACPADAFAQEGAQCAAASCSLGASHLPTYCSGVEAQCPSSAPQSCGPYLCGATACTTSCATAQDCAAGSNCIDSACTTLSPLAATCIDDGTCLSGHCVDGVCCNTACNGQCEACDSAGSAGTCGSVTGAPHPGRAACGSDGSACAGQCDGIDGAQCTYPGDAVICREASCSDRIATKMAVCDGHGACPARVLQSCAPFSCGSQACLGDCKTNTDCAVGSFCSLGVCAPKRAPGENCASKDECGSAFCVDGVCCNSACNGQCEACNGDEAVGTCAPITGAPRGAHAACATDGSLCGGSCNGIAQDHCTYPDASSVCRAGSCGSGIATLEASCNGAGACPAKQTQSCAPYACGAETCLGDCNADADCQGAQFCSAGVCTAKRGPGQSCGATDQCGSGFCVDGLCCTTACTGQCEACDLPGTPGVCSPSAGQPHGAREACKGAPGSTCGGTCDGTHSAACAYAAAKVICRQPSCTDGMATLPAACDGIGFCPAAAQQACGELSCGPTACLGDCSDEAPCPSGLFCSAGVCVTNRAPGETCSSASQCGSGFCADGVCCNAACNGQCEACDLPFAQGVCSPVAGDPHGSRRACDGQGPCGATCDGTSTEACVFADAKTTCGPASCSGDKAQAASTCDGAGTCKPTEAKECGAYACTDGACAASCTTDDQCAYRFACQEGGCHPIEIYQVPTTIECSWSVAGDAAAGPSPWLVGFSALLFARRRRRRN